MPATVKVHVIFVDADRNGLSPKAIERERRDASRQSQISDVIVVEDSTSLPNNWQAFLGNRQQNGCL